jgi:hypothetical protein
VVANKRFLIHKYKRESCHQQYNPTFGTINTSYVGAISSSESNNKSCIKLGLHLHPTMEVRIFLLVVIGIQVGKVTMVITS